MQRRIRGLHRRERQWLAMEGGGEERQKKAARGGKCGTRGGGAAIAGQHKGDTPVNGLRGGGGYAKQTSTIMGLSARKYQLNNEKRKNSSFQHNT